MPYQDNASITGLIDNITVTEKAQRKLFSLYDYN